MLVALLLGIASAAVCFLLLLMRGLSIPLILACSAAVGFSCFLLGLSAEKLASHPKRKKPLPAYRDEEPFPFQPPPIVTLKSKSPQELERERILQILEQQKQERNPENDPPIQSFHMDI